MADRNDKNAANTAAGSGFSRFGLANLREFGAKAAAQVNDLNVKVLQQQLHPTSPQTAGSETTTQQQHHQHQPPATATDGSAMPSALHQQSATSDANASAPTRTVSGTLSSLLGRARAASGDGAETIAASFTSTSSSSDATVPTSMAALKDKNVSRDDLLEILQKMNKKVKALTTIRQQLLTQVEQEKSSKRAILQLVTDEILNGAIELPPEPVVPNATENVSTASDESYTKEVVERLQAAWRRVDEQNALNLQSLQSEFQRLQREQLEKSNGGDSNTSSWETEKTALLQQHQQELQNLRESLQQQHVEELERLKNQQPVLAPPASPDGMMTKQQHEEELHKLKSAAAAQLHSFKKKVAAARTQELEKLQQVATLDLQSKLAAKETEHAAAVEQLKQQLALLSSSSSSTEQLQSLQGLHAQQLEQMKAEHAAALEKQRVETEQVVRQQLQQQIEQLQREQKQKESDFEQWKQSYQSQLQTFQAELAKAVQEKDAAIMKTQSEMMEAAEKERHALVEQFAKDKQALSTEMEQKLQAAVQQAQAAVSMDHQTVLQDLRTQFERQLEDERTRLLQVKNAELKKLQLELSTALERGVQEATARASSDASSDLSAAQSNFEAKLEALQGQLTQQTMDLENAQQRERALAGELEDVRARLVSEANEKAALMAASSDDSNKSIEEALSKQRISFEEMIEKQKQRYAEEMQSMKQRFDELSNARNEAHADVVSLQKELQSLKDISSANITSMELERNNLQKALAAREAELVDKENLHRQESSALKNTLDSIMAKEREWEAKLQKAAASNSQLEADQSTLRDRLVQLDDEKKAAIISMQQNFDAKVADLEARLHEKSAEVQRLASADQGANAAYNALKAQYDDVQAQLDNLRKSMESDGSPLIEQRIAEVRLSILSEKEKEVESVKKEYEEKLDAATKKKDAITQAFQKAKDLYMQKLHSVETTMSKQIDELKKENLSFQEAIMTVQEEKSALQSQIDALNSLITKKDADFAEERTKLMEEYKNDKEAQNKVQEENMAQLSKLQEELDGIRKQFDDAKAIGSEEIKVAYEEKMKLLEAQHSEALNKIKEEYEVTVNNKMQEHEAEKKALELDVTSRMEKQAAEHAVQLEAQSRRHQEEKEELRKSFEAHTDKMQTHFKGKLEAMQKKAREEIENLQKAGSEKDEKMKMVIGRLKEFTTSTSALRTENESLRTRVKQDEEALQRTRMQLESTKQELENTVANSSATASSLLQEQENLQRDKKSLEDRLRKLRMELDTRKNEADELKGKLDALTSNLNAMAEERREQDEKLQHAARQEAKLKSSEAEVSDLREQINKLKLEMMKNANLVNRLQAEKDANERSRGQDTAMVGMLETQLSEISERNAEINAKLEAALYDLSQKDETIQTTEEHIRKLESELAAARDATKRANEALSLAQKGADSKSSKVLESLQKELQVTKQQMARKSSAAQRLLQEREAECAELRKQNKALQQEVDKGSLSDRRIFELAARQSNRETLQVSEIDIRDQTIQLLKEALLERDGSLAAVETTLQQAESQLEEAARVRRREDVNLDYLKSIVVQYLSKPPGSSERARLLPVLATLLQFNDMDYKTIEEGKNKVSWWGNVAPTLINPPDSTNSETRTSEVSVSSSSRISSARQNGKGTSLQF